MVRSEPDGIVEMRDHLKLFVILVFAFCHAAPSLGASVEEQLEQINRMPDKGRAEVLEREAPKKESWSGTPPWRATEPES